MLSNQVDKISADVVKQLCPVAVQTHGVLHSLAPVILEADAEDRVRPISSPRSVAKLRAAVRSRRRRSDFFGQDLFADPAWDILLDLYIGHLQGAKITVSSACVGSAAPQTTALRWIKVLHDRQLIERKNDPQDGRRIYLSLTPQALKAMERYLSSEQALL